MTQLKRLAVRSLGAGLLGVMTFFFVVLSWAPFELDPPTRVTNAVVEGDDVFSFGEASRVTASLDDPVSASGILEFGIRYTCQGTVPRGRVVTLSTARGRPVLSIDQVDDRLLLLGPSGSQPVALRGTRTGEACDAWLELRLDLGTGEITMLGPHTTQVTTMPEAIRWPERIDFGTPPVGDDHWQGEIRRPRLLTPDGAVDLTDDLQVPASFWVLPSRLLGAGDRDRAELVEARLWHAVGGLLLGLGIGAAWPRVPLRRCLTVGVAFVVLLNLGKILVAYRHPSIGTALLQAGGLGVGAACTRFGVPRAFLDPASSADVQVD